jgi:hypothetical protein
MVVTLNMPPFIRKALRQSRSTWTLPRLLPFSAQGSQCLVRAFELSHSIRYSCAIRFHSPHGRETRRSGRCAGHRCEFPSSGNKS